MKKTVSINVNGRAFTIDEDAYQLLDNYLKNLRHSFRKEKGVNDIIADFEARIEELLGERIRLGAQIINKEHVEDVIRRIGQPDEISDDAGKEDDNRQNFTAEQPEAKKKLFRDPDDKMFGGVFSGLAAYMGWNATALRLIAVVMMFITTFWLVPIYLIFWLLLPEAKTAAEKLQMRGQPVTVENIGKTVSGWAENNIPQPDKSRLSGCLGALVVVIKYCLIGLGIIIGIPMIFSLIVAIIGLIAMLFGAGGIFLRFFPAGFMNGFLSVDYHPPVLLIILLLFVIGLPLIALIYAIIGYFAKFKPVDKVVKWTLLAVWFLAFIALIINTFSFPFRWKPFFSYSIEKSVSYYDTHKEFLINEPFNCISTDFANTEVEIKQIKPDEQSRVEVSGSQDAVDNFRYEIVDNILKIKGLKQVDKSNFVAYNFKAKIYTSDLNEIRLIGMSTVTIPDNFVVEQLKVENRGSSTFKADNLNVKSLKIETKGAGNVTVAGNSELCDFTMDGVGSIKADNLVADSVYAEVKGVGSIVCFPVLFLHGKMLGVGKLTYKNEPRTKTLTMIGLGKVGKE